MNEKPETSEDMYIWPPVSGIKRSRETSNQWPEYSEGSTAALARPTKKACTPRLTYSQESDIPESSNFEEYVTLPPIRSLGFESASFAELNPFSSTHLLPLTDDVTCSWQQSLGNSWQPQVLRSQYPTAEDHGFTQQWVPQNPEEWHCIDSTDNTYMTQPTPNIALIQTPAGHDELGFWQAPGCGQQEQSFITKEVTTLKLDNSDTAMDDNMVMGFDDVGNFQDGEHTSQSDDEHRGCTSPAKLSPVSQSITEGGLSASDETPTELSYDSCFGVIIFEKFQLQDGFFTGKATKHISLEINGTMVIIKDANSNKYGGLLDRRASRILVDLFKDHDVELAAYMKTPDRIEVLIYGRLEQSDAIGDMLLQQDYFLQRPDSHDPSRPYYNPQCLSDPDKEDDPSWECNKSITNQTAILDEREKTKVAELLDSATGPTNFRTVQISDILITRLKKHQVKALSMMIEKESGNIRDAEFPSVWTENSDLEPSYLRFYNTVTQNSVARTPRLCLGGLLADEMGLGKTLTTLSLIATSLLSKGDKNPHVARVTLIVCPMTTVTCWQDQIERHFEKGSLIYKIYHGSSKDDDAAALKGADIVLTTYETLRAGFPDEGIVMRKGMRSRRAGLLHDIDWHRVVLDEAHIVRNRSTKSFQAVNMLKAKHRWCLTGTPIQNRLDDLGALVEFLKVDPFDNPSTFRNTFLSPIDSGEKSGWERLRSLIRSIALRRTKKALDGDLSLPARRETVHWINLDNEERALYNLVKKHFALAINSGAPVMNTFQFILRLRQICNHGSDLLPQSLRAWLNEAASLWGAVSPLLQRCEVCDTALDDSNSSYDALSCFHQVCQTCLPADDAPNNGTGSVCPVCDTGILEETEGGIKPKPDHKSGSMRYRPSSKVKALLQNLQNDREVAITSGQPSAKSVVFSAWTGMLDLIGEALSKNGFVYQRLDGSKSLPERRHALEDFRANSNCIVLLASLGSAAVGLDLTMATRVHLMEPGWNPLLEQQAIDRVHRLGQGSEVLATRYIVAGSDSIEQYVRRRQEWKMNLIATSLDEPKARHDEAEAMIEDLRRTICI
ncbi:SNF2 family N-terminal domain-containing protein [Hypoxylon sp. NC0597]|nr:SNF2 family N-terminal domain-containing protein [Hypoxylon sp. NC0597]